MTTRSSWEKKTEGSKLFDISLSNIWGDVLPWAKATNAKINKCDYINPKSHCTAKETSHKTQKQPIKWEKIFANDISDKCLISDV